LLGCTQVCSPRGRAGQAGDNRAAWHNPPRDHTAPGRPHSCSRPPTWALAGRNGSAPMADQGAPPPDAGTHPRPSGAPGGQWWARARARSDCGWSTVARRYSRFAFSPPTDGARGFDNDTPQQTNSAGTQGRAKGPRRWALGMYGRSEKDSPCWRSFDEQIAPGGVCDRSARMTGLMAVIRLEIVEAAPRLAGPQETPAGAGAGVIVQNRRWVSNRAPA